MYEQKSLKQGSWTSPVLPEISEFGIPVASEISFDPTRTAIASMPVDPTDILAHEILEHAYAHDQGKGSIEYVVMEVPHLGAMFDIKLSEFDAVKIENMSNIGRIKNPEKRAREKLRTSYGGYEIPDFFKGIFGLADAEELK